MMGFERRELDSESRIIIFKPGVGESFGILVDRIGDVVEVEYETIEERGNEKQGRNEGQERRSTKISLGVCKLEDNVMVLPTSSDELARVSSELQEMVSTFKVATA